MVSVRLAGESCVVVEGDSAVCFKVGGWYGVWVDLRLW